MQKRIVAIALCLVMVSTVAATGAVSATTVGKSNIRTFDVYWRPGWNPAIGKATLNLDTGHLVVNVNINKIRDLDPLWFEGRPYNLNIYSPPSNEIGLWTVNQEDVVMSLTADGTATLDTYLDPGLVTDPAIVTWFWDNPGTFMWL